jgi:hypothetical protein
MSAGTEIQVLQERFDFVCAQLATALDRINEIEDIIGREADRLDLLARPRWDRPVEMQVEIQGVADVLRDAVRPGSERPS